MAAKEVLVVDDEIGIRELLAEILFDEGYKITLAESAAEAKRIRNARAPDLVLLDIWMPEQDGLSLLKDWIAALQLTMPVIMMSGHGTIDTAMEAIRLGAVDFLEKPIALNKLLKTLAEASVRPLPLVAPVSSHQQPGVLEIKLAGHSLRSLHEEVDAAYFQYLLEQMPGNMSQVAEVAGVERTHLYRKLKQLGIKPGKKKPAE